MAVTRLAAAVLCLAVMLGPAGAEEGDPPAAGPAIAFEPVVAHAVDAVILPGYAALAAAASDETALVETLCRDVDPDSLQAARAGFARLATAWSGVEMLRLGPAREDNRFERLFFWPDPRGRGLQQVQGILAAADESATSVDSLRAKSVAVQGLLALEFVLHGTGSEALADPAAASGAFRCRYAAAIAGAVALTSGEIRDGWTRAGGYADLMRGAGADDPVFRSHGEVVQDLIKAAREQVQLVREQKLAQSIGETPEAAQPKRAPFWRSNLVIPAILGNLDAVVALVGPEGIGTALPADKAWAAGQVSFELGRVDAVLGRLAAPGTAWEQLAQEPKAHGDLVYTLIPLGDVAQLLETDFTDALGLITGFNSLDGD
ncbi:MAG: hypothetical protein J0H08_16075 [Rhizobiales bacterium]|nr:hypothetical protein [Hyphomicrobiales bacterium]